MPIFMVTARIVAKREEVSTNSSYYISFADANGKAREFEVNSRDYAQFATGDIGRLSYDQVGRYVRFEPGELAFHLR